MPPRPAMSIWVEQLQARGRYTFTRARAESETERSFMACASQEPYRPSVLRVDRS